MSVSNRRSKLNLCTLNSPPKPQSFQPCWEKAALCMLLQLRSIICFMSIRQQWFYKELYLFKGYVSSVHAVGHLFIIGCILWARERKTRCQFTEEEGPRGTGRTAGPFAVLSLFTPSVGGLLNWLAWPGTLKTIQNHLRPSQHVLQGASALFRDPRTQGDLYVPWTMVCRSVQFHADSLIFQTADCS